VVATESLVDAWEEAGALHETLATPVKRVTTRNRESIAGRRDKADLL
jgi:hypothetical protein